MKKDLVLREVIKKTFKYILIPLGLILIFDYYNVFSLCGLHIENINAVLLGASLNAIVVIILFIVTFEYVDKRQLAKEHNSKDTANLLLLDTYKECFSTLEMINNQQILEKYIIPKIDFNKTDSDNKVKMNLLDLPFMEHASILDLASDGAIAKKDLQTYLDIKRRYKSYISNKITFFDVDKIDNASPKQEALAQFLSQSSTDLVTILSKEIKNLESIKDENPENTKKDDINS